MDYQKLIETIEMVAKNEGVVELHPYYSGRAMYGAMCLGVSGSFKDCKQLLAQVVFELHCEDDNRDFADAITALLDFETDSLGHDTILYWRQLVTA